VRRFGGGARPSQADQQRGGQPAASDSALRDGVGGDLASGADGAVVRASDGRAADREGDVHQRGSGAGRDPQFQRGRLRVAVPALQGRSPAEVHRTAAREIKRIALSRPEDHEQPFSTWSLSKLADYLVDKGVVEDISHERLRTMLREQGVSFQRIKTWKELTDLRTAPSLCIGSCGAHAASMPSPTSEAVTVR
jgi:hypothetical protein